MMDEYTYTWKIVGMKVKNQSDNINDLVVGVRWRVTAEDENGNIAHVNAGSVIRPAVDPDYVYTPLEELTEEQVIEWVKADAIQYWGFILEKLQSQLDLQEKELDVLPWNNKA